jgi:50S ribosomal protein L16 3-hydroxylase
VPAALQRFCANAVSAALGRAGVIERALGEVLTEPKPQVWFEPRGQALRAGQGVSLDARTRMLVDARHVFVNGESWRAAGGDARLLRALAHARRLEPRDVARLGASARAVLEDWLEAGWIHPQESDAAR